MNADKESVLRKRKKAQGRSMSLYKQIHRELEEQMLSGKLPLGARIPTEKELCDLYGVSRVTARKALDDLKEEGLIMRTRGCGSFVNKLPAISKSENSVKATEILVAVRVDPPGVGSIPESWGEQVLQHVSKHLFEDGFHVSLLPIEDLVKGNEERKWKRFWQRVNSFGERLGGAFIFTNFHTKLLIEGFEKRNLPWVSFGKTTKEKTANFVSANNFDGGEKVGVALAQAGYEHVIFLSTSLETISSGDRFYGLLKGWLGSGRSLNSVRLLSVEDYSGLNEQEQVDFERELKQQSGRCAVFCTGDLIASSVLKLCDRLGVVVPEQLAVVGGTGLSLAEHTTPTLTVLAQPMQEIGRVACEMLLEMIRTGRMQVPGRYVESPVIRRESCPIGE